MTNISKNSQFVISLVAILVVGTLGISSVFAEDKMMKDAMQKETVYFTGDSDGWLILNGEARPASMVFVGEATEQQNNIWKLKSTVDIDYENLGVEMLGSANPEKGKIKLTGTGTGENGVNFILILRGNYAPIENSENKFAVDWSYAGIHVPENKLKIPLYQDGIFVIQPN